MDLTPPRFPDDYYAHLEGRHAAAVAAVALVGVLRNGGRLTGLLPLSAEQERGLHFAGSVLVGLTVLDWREGHATDGDYLLALKAERALRALRDGETPTAED